MKDTVAAYTRHRKLAIRTIAADPRAGEVILHPGAQRHAGRHANRVRGRAAHFACAYVTPHAHEFSSFIDARDHVADQDLVIKDGHLILPEGPGIGLTLDSRKLKKYRLDL